MQNILYYHRHPIDRGRLCYLYKTKDDDEDPLERWDRYWYDTWYKMLDYVNSNPILMTKTVLERPEELQDLVIDFLQTLPKCH